ncbi:MAG: bifunctional biotin--[acetyl-CoA-carboxylase] ligase/biotin operon repressor BirA [Gammaproteobacteria bacterium]
MQRRYRLLRFLADGRFHSGEELGHLLGVGRAAVWKLMQSLEPLGLDVYAVRGKGYRLAEPLELLNEEQVLAELNPLAATLLHQLEVVPEIDSTNRYLMERARSGTASANACFAEYQSAGRGRQGRPWISPFGTNVYVSVLRRFDVGAEALQGLSLAAGVAVARALSSLGVSELKLKWPNDLVWRERKLGGLLVETAGEPAGPWHVVVGVGLNLSLPEASARLIDQPWVDLKTVAPGQIGRNRVAGRLLLHLLTGLEEFSRHGFAAFRQEWERYDLVRDRLVSVSGVGSVTHGRACGVDHTGALLLSVAGQIRRVLSGDVSLRVAV